MRNLDDTPKSSSTPQFKRVGLLINFGGNTLKEGLHRAVNNLEPSASPRLRVNQGRLPLALDMFVRKGQTGSCLRL